MSQTLRLSDELYRALERYAQEHQQTPEEALASLLKDIWPQGGSAVPTSPAPGGEPSQEPPKNAGNDQGEYLNPWEGFYGAFEAKYPDLIERHDYYIGQAALETHEDQDDDFTS